MDPANEPPPVNLKPDKIPCMTPNCGKERKWKGVCASCYGQAKRLIDEEKTTWEELEQMGLVLLDSKPFYAAFKQKKSLLDNKEQKS